MTNVIFSLFNSVNLKHKPNSAYSETACITSFNDVFSNIPEKNDFIDIKNIELLFRSQPMPFVKNSANKELRQNDLLDETYYCKLILFFAEQLNCESPCTNGCSDQDENHQVRVKFPAKCKDPDVAPTPSDLPVPASFVQWHQMTAICDDFAIPESPPPTNEEARASALILLSACTTTGPEARCAGHVSQFLGLPHNKPLEGPGGSLSAFGAGFSIHAEPNKKNVERLSASINISANEKADITITHGTTGLLISILANKESTADFIKDKIFLDNFFSSNDTLQNAEINITTDNLIDFNEKNNQNQYQNHNSNPKSKKEFDPKVEFFHSFDGDLDFVKIDTDGIFI